MTVQTQQNVFTGVMIGAVGAVWISLVGLFILAVTHDGQIANQVAQEAMQVVVAAIGGFSTVAGIHVWTANHNPTSAAPEPATPPAAASK